MPAQTTTSAQTKLKMPVVFLIIFSAILMFRLSLNLPTYHNTYIGSYFRIGLIPWSDAAGWVSGSEQISEGYPISGYPARRPLYPLFLASLFSIFGDDDYANVVFVQILLACLSVSFAFLFLRNVRERLPVILFMTFLALWRPAFQSLFLTENLGIFILIASFALIWSGVSNGTESRICSGFFLLGLSQAVRPYSILCLATVPLVAFFAYDSSRKKIFFIFMFFICLGYGFHMIAALLFNQSGTDLHYSIHLYGQVTGGKGWTAASYDPLIMEQIRRNVSPKELNAFIYHRALELFFENPYGLFKGILNSYKCYFQNLHYAFRAQHKFFPLFFCLFVLCDNTRTFREFFLGIKNRKLFWLCMPVLFFSYPYFCLLFFIIGMMYAAIRYKDPLNAFSLLYFLGILLSLPLIGGEDGGNRIKISSDIFLFFIAANGFSRLISHTDTGKKLKFDWDRSDMVKVCGVLFFSFLIFIGFPYLIKMRGASNRVAEKTPLAEKKQIADMLNLEKEELVGPVELEALENKWPEPSYEKFSRKSVYTEYIHKNRYTVFLKADEGININHPEFWPMQTTSPKLERTVLISLRDWIVFPGIKPRQLWQFNKRRILVIGTLTGIPRRWRHDTGYVIFARYIGFLNSSEKLVWIALSDLKK